MKKMISHIKLNILKGLLAIIPLALSLFIIRLLYVAIDQRVLKFLKNTIGFSFPGIGILSLLSVLYIIGIVTSHLVGKQILNLIERILNHIPLIKTTYQIGKQLSTTISLPEKHVFKRVVLVDFLKPGIWVVGFVTGTIIDTKNNYQKLLKVYVPTPPNPTSGTMVIVKESDTRDPGWTIEEALKIVISGGIIGPEEIK